MSPLVEIIFALALRAPARRRWRDRSIARTPLSGPSASDVKDLMTLSMTASLEARMGLAKAGGAPRCYAMSRVFRSRTPSLPGLVPGIHVFNVARRAIVGGRERLRSN
jgi:hypothetical protein